MAETDFDLNSQPPYVLNERKREIVLAAHVRSNHVHLILGAGVRPEYIVRDMNPGASRRGRALSLGEAWEHTMAVEGYEGLSGSALSR